MGYGLRYEYGIFRQEIQKGYQTEFPDHWLRQPDPWEVARPRETVQIALACSFRLENGTLRAVPDQPSHLLGIPYDRPAVGWGGRTINTLRLWAAASPDFFDFGEFSSGDFVGAIVDRMVAETVTRVLYPDDSTVAGQALRFVQEYFLVCCSLADIVARFRGTNNEWHSLPENAAIQMNDTHPALAVAELMRILLDEAGLGWDRAWDLTVRTLAYTNHTLLPEALEKWPVDSSSWFARAMLGDHLRDQPPTSSTMFGIAIPGDEDKVRADEPDRGGARDGRCGWRIWLSSALTAPTVLPAFIRNCCARNRARLRRDVPRAFQQQDQRCHTAPLAAAGQPRSGRPHHRRHRRQLGHGSGRAAQACAAGRRRGVPPRFPRGKACRQGALRRLGSNRRPGKSVDPDTIFDSQIKRIHEYKRQL